MRRIEASVILAILGGCGDGTKFQRFEVPTHSGAAVDRHPAVGRGRRRAKDGTMKFIDGYVIAATGTERNGWMAYDALTVSDGCP